MHGGDYGPYSVKIGLVCNSMVEVRMLDHFVKIFVASSIRRKELLWRQYCAGEGKFGVVLRIKLETASSSLHDQVVVFRVEWSWKKGEIYKKKGSEYGYEGRSVRVKLSSNQDSGVFLYDACYDVREREQSMALLRKAKLF